TLSAVLSPFFFSRPRRPPRSPLFPYTTLFRSVGLATEGVEPLVARIDQQLANRLVHLGKVQARLLDAGFAGQQVFRGADAQRMRSEEHTSELQSRENLVCRLLLEKKKKIGHEK